MNRRLRKLKKLKYPTRQDMREIISLQDEKIIYLKHKIEGCQHKPESVENPMEKAKRELQGYKNILSTVWSEDLTDEQELLYLKFYQEGIKISNHHGKPE